MIDEQKKDQQKKGLIDELNDYDPETDEPERSPLADEVLGMSTEEIEELSEEE